MHNNKTNCVLIRNTYPDYHQNGATCNNSNTIVPDYYPNPQFSDNNYHIHHPHHCCENKYPEIVDISPCNGDCGSCYLYDQMNHIAQDLIETENIEYRVPVLENFPWQEAVKSKISDFLPIKPSKGDRYLIYFPTNNDDQINNTEDLENTTNLTNNTNTEPSNEDINIDDTITDNQQTTNVPSCSCPCQLLKQYQDAIIWYDGKNWNVNRPSAGWTVYVEDEKIKYVYHPDTGWLIDNNNPNKTSHNSDFYYSDKSEVIFADLEIL